MTNEILLIHLLLDYTNFHAKIYFFILLVFTYFTYKYSIPNTACSIFIFYLNDLILDQWIVRSIEHCPLKCFFNYLDTSFGSRDIVV